MKSGTWFALCSASRAIELDALLRELPVLDDEKPRLDGGVLIVEVDNDLDGAGKLTIHLSKDPHVVVEARELAARKAADRPDRDAIAKLDARYELSFPLKQADAVYDTLLDVAATIHRLCGAVIYNQVNGEFVDVR